MTLLHTQPLLDATHAPETSARKRARSWLRDGQREPASVPGIDLDAIRRAHGPDTAFMPRTLRGAFRVPLDVDLVQYQTIKHEAITRWLQWMQQEGYDWDRSRIVVSPGIYPAQDLDGTKDLGAREFYAATRFVYRYPKVQRLELDPRWLAPIR